MKKYKNIDDEIIDEINNYIEYIISQMIVDVDENNVYHEYEAFEWTLGVLNRTEEALKEIKNHKEDKEAIYNSIKSIEHIININKEHYNERKEK